MALSSTELSQLNARLEAYMQQHRLRSTAQRRLVTDTFFRSEGHISIDDLFQEVRRQDRRVGYATIYRTLKLLKDIGLAHERHFGDGVSRYEVAHEDEHHDHLICTVCQRIIEFEDPKIEALQEALARQHGFVLQGHRHELYGTCDEPTTCPHRKAGSA